MAIHTALTAKDASLHLKLQHGFRSAQVSLWVDDDLAFSGRITGSTRKKFGLIPTDTQQGSLSQIVAVPSGEHKIRVRVQPDDAAAQEDTISGDFASNAERALSVSARHSGLSMSWQGTSSARVETSLRVLHFWELLRQSLFLTITGSIMSALAGYAIRELPGKLRPAADASPKAVVRS